MDHLKRNQCREVLDLGCGTGTHLLQLAEAGFQVTGFDLSHEGIRLTRQRFAEAGKDGSFFQGSMHDPLPFADESFDAIVSLRALNHGTQREIEFVASEMYRILRPGGYVFFTTIKIVGRKNILGPTRLNGLRANIIAPYTYQPLEGKEIGITHFALNRRLIKSIFHVFSILGLWIEYGQKSWERYYCVFAQKT